jgi:hypothetical protein
VVKTVGIGAEETSDKVIVAPAQPSAASLLQPSVPPSYSSRPSLVDAGKPVDSPPSLAPVVESSKGPPTDVSQGTDATVPPSPAPVAVVPDTPETPLNPRAPLLRPKPVVLDSRLKSPLRASASAPPASGTPGPTVRAPQAPDATKKRLRPELGLSMAPAEPAARPKPRVAAGLRFGVTPPSQRPHSQSAFLGTGLSKTQREDLATLGRMLGVRVDNEFHPSVTTHVISGDCNDLLPLSSPFRWWYAGTFHPQAT